MRAYLIKRLFLMIPTLFGIALVVFVIINVAPGQPTPIQVGAGTGEVSGEQLASKESLLIFKRQWNLDKPILFNVRPFRLDEEEVDRLIRRTIWSPSQKERIAASEELENLWLEAVPHFVSLLAKAREGAGTLAGEERDRNDQLRLYLVAFLSQNAKRRVRKVHKDADVEEYTDEQKEVLARNEAIGKEKARFDAWKYLWSDFDPTRPEGRESLEKTRDRIEQKWLHWFHGHASRFADAPPAPDAAEAALRLARRNPPGPGESPAEHRASLAANLLERYGPGAGPALVEHLLARPGDRETWKALTPIAVELFRDLLPAPPPERTQEVKARRAFWEDNLYREGLTPPQWKQFVLRWQEWWRGAEHRFERTGLEKVLTFLTDTRFAQYMAKLSTLSFGESIQYKGEKVTDLIEDRLKVSITFAVLAFLISYTVSIPIGIFSAVYKDSVADRALTFVLFLLYATPSFYLATILLRYLTTPEYVSLFPTGGFHSTNADDFTTFEYLKDVAWHIVLPLICLTYASFATLSRYARAGLLEVIRSDYVRTARAKGLSEPVVILKHALRNGVIPILTMVGGILPALIGGSVIIETVFNVNGMGKLMFDAIVQRDYNVVMADSLIAAFLVLCGILISDITYVLVDPRISFE